MYRQTNPYRTRNINSDKVAVRSSVGTWYGTFWTIAGVFVSYQILKNNLRNTANTAEMVKQLQEINNKIK